MILIADSGSTKTDWRIIYPNGQIEQAKSKGFNPNYQSAEFLIQDLQNQLLTQLNGTVSEVHFYGAGCSGERNVQVVKAALASLFDQATIQVMHDMLAAARALCGHEAGIACILGTGANACLYDGKEIISQAPAPGYILGDEGAGSHIGKQLVTQFIYQELPSHLHAAFEKRYKTSRNQIVENLYQQPMPSQYLAGFSQFAFHHLADPYVYKLVYDGFQLFFERNVKKFENYQQHKVHVTGSIGFFYSNLLRQVANDQGIHLKNILESPIAGLTLYHTAQL